MFEVLHQAAVTSHGVSGRSSLPIQYTRSSNNNDENSASPHATVRCRGRWTSQRSGISCARPRGVTIATGTHLLQHYHRHHHHHHREASTPVGYNNNIRCVAVQCAQAKYRVAQKKIAQSLMHRHSATVSSRNTRFSSKCSEKINAKFA